MFTEEQGKPVCFLWLVMKECVGNESVGNESW